MTALRAFFQGPLDVPVAIGPLTAESVDALVSLYELEWRGAQPAWDVESARSDAVACVCTRAVCEWAGVPVEDEELGCRTDDLAVLADPATARVVREVRRWAAQVRSQWWLAQLVRIHRESPCAPIGSALDVVAVHRVEGKLLAARKAAGLLLELLRPTVAVVRHVVLESLTGLRRGTAAASPEPLALIATKVGARAVSHRLVARLRDATCRLARSDGEPWSAAEPTALQGVPHDLRA